MHAESEHRWTAKASVWQLRDCISQGGREPGEATKLEQVPQRHWVHKHRAGRGAKHRASSLFYSGPLMAADENDTRKKIICLPYKDKFKEST